jgi:phosphohistidine phosphatase
MGMRRLEVLLKTLLLMRHAKAKRHGLGMADFDRPLAKRGRYDAPRMAELLEDQTLYPDWIVSSTAQRAAQTAEAVAEAIGHEGAISWRDELYGGDVDDYARAVSEAPDGADCVLLVAHNPTLVDLLADLTGRVENLPTGAVAQVELSIHQWLEVMGWPKGRLVASWRPRELPATI